MKNMVELEVTGGRVAVVRVARKHTWPVLLEIYFHSSDLWNLVFEMVLLGNCDSCKRNCDSREWHVVWNWRCQSIDLLGSWDSPASLLGEMILNEVMILKANFHFSNWPTGPQGFPTILWKYFQGARFLRPPFTFWKNQWKTVLKVQVTYRDSLVFPTKYFQVSGFA